MSFLRKRYGIDLKMYYGISYEEMLRTLINSGPKLQHILVDALLPDELIMFEQYINKIDAHKNIYDMLDVIKDTAIVFTDDDYLKDWR